jgi:predicted O-methyltransferase YrrM
MQSLYSIMSDEGLFLDEARKWGTDKLTKHPYTEEYDVLFEKWRDKPVRLLEIGAYYGASTIAWDKYFPLGDITVVDIEPRTALDNIKGRVDENRTRILIGDAYTEEFADTLGTFDIINDDGPHSLESMIKCVELYYPKLNPNGVMAIEDIPYPSWMDILIEKLPKGTRTKIVDYPEQGRGASDSRILIAWR